MRLFMYAFLAAMLLHGVECLAALRQGSKRRLEGTCFSA